MTTKGTFTPGPYYERTRTILNIDHDLKHEEEAIEIAQVSTDNTLAYVPFAAQGIVDTEAEGNAKLFIAAPDLLAACEAAREALRISRPLAHETSGGPILAAACKQLEAAIARARGSK